MERMEVDQCAGAAAGALRRSISAPMITNVSKRMAACAPVVLQRQRRVSINCGCPSQEDNMEASLQESPPPRLSASRQLPAPPGGQWQRPPPAQWFGRQESGATPNSSPSSARRASGGAHVRWPALVPLKRKGGAESDGPPKKLFVTGVFDPAHRSRYVLSASAAESDPGCGPPSPPPTFAALPPP
ncbi:PABIR family member 2 [Hippocampus zosterae]|uniref:PABIR family member 2 n=1 Tax=Hippocampus zosterae TaxID=109293 RepID=UPI00223E802D|nr:PABIR family member 2 [Hippocampus zosterae]